MRANILYVLKKSSAQRCFCWEGCLLLVLRIRSAHLGIVSTNIQRHFYAVYDYAGKEDLRNGYWNPKRKLRVTTHFSEIIKLQSGKKKIIPYIVMYFKAFQNIIIIV